MHKIVRLQGERRILAAFPILTAISRYFYRFAVFLPLFVTSQPEIILAMEVEQHATPIVERGGRRGQKRKRRRSNEVNALKAPRGAAKGGAGTAEDDRESRPRHRQMSVSSKTVANHVMTTRLLGSESDPLNLEGLVGGATKEEREGEGECSTCAPSPVFAQTTLLAPPLSGNPRDPLNLEGQIPEHSTAGFNRPGEESQKYSHCYF